MKLIRCEYNGKVYHGRIDKDEVALFDDFPQIEMKDGSKRILLSEEKGRVPLSFVRLKAPCVPGKAVCVGLNYRDHAKEFGLAIPSSPVLFIKPSTSLLDPYGEILYPSISSRVDYEAELVAVIGAKAKNVEKKDALNYILGYTCGNDVTARDLQPKDGQWTVAKSFDTFMPLGPWIETELDPSNLRVQAILNGEVRQLSSTENLIFNVADLVAYISQIMTLEPGDAIMTGTPSGVGPMQKGDRIIIEIQGIGRLENIVA
jgi:2-keto-4-pentenoate hydratase/2-oxohepta-3-ene-1,7-dioic acid hydratase in catechol pathway